MESTETAARSRRELEDFLESNDWVPVSLVHSLWRRGRMYFFNDEVWQKAKSRLLVDEIGVFFYRYVGRSRWERTAGRSHDLVTRNLALKRKRIKFEGATLDLLTGGWELKPAPIEGGTGDAPGTKAPTA